MQHKKTALHRNLSQCGPSSGKPKARGCHYPRPTRSGGRGNGSPPPKGAHGEGDCVELCISIHYTLALSVGSRNVFPPTPPSANAPDGDSDTTEPMALRDLNCIVQIVLYKMCTATFRDHAEAITLYPDNSALKNIRKYFFNLNRFIIFAIC